MAPSNIIVYGVHGSPPVRSTLMTAKALGIQIQFKLINPGEGDHLSTEFLKINPQHTIPTLDDNGFIIWDSHAINTYLATQYFEDSPFYPADPKQRALIDQRLHFDGGVFFSRILAWRHSQGSDPELFAKVVEAYDFLETFLANSTWLVGEKPTLADISLVASASTANLVTPFEEKKYPKIFAWLRRCEAEPWYAANITGLEQIKKRFADELSKRN